jgi:TolB-like protein
MRINLRRSDAGVTEEILGFLQRPARIKDIRRKSVVSFRSRRVLRICVVIRAGGIRVVKFAPVMMSRVAIPGAAA